jgi:hypothetical protein
MKTKERGDQKVDPLRFLPFFWSVYEFLIELRKKSLPTDLSRCRDSRSKKFDNVLPVIAFEICKLNFKSIGARRDYDAAALSGAWPSDFINCVQLNLIVTENAHPSNGAIRKKQTIPDIHQQQVSTQDREQDEDSNDQRHFDRIIWRLIPPRN